MNTQNPGGKVSKRRRKTLERIANDDFVGSLEHHNAKDGGDPLSADEIAEELHKVGIPLTLKQRLEQAAEAWENREKRAFYQVDLAKACSTSPTAVWMWFEGKTVSLRGKNLLAAANFFGVLPQWLDTGMLPMFPTIVEATGATSKYVRIPRLALRAAAGAGIAPDEHVEVQEELSFRRDWLARKGLKQEYLQIYESRGNSMAPYIEDGDVILIDTEALMPKSNEVWVICQAGSVGIRVKRLMIRENGDLIIRSDNPDKTLYPDELVSNEHLIKIEIIGKLAWRGG